MGWESPGGTTHFAPPAYTHHTHHHYEAAAYSGLVEGSALCSQAGLPIKKNHPKKPTKKKPPKKPTQKNPPKNPLKFFFFWFLGFFKIFNFFF
jgi:hypothetical protein